MSTTIPLSPDRSHETRATELVAALAAGPAIAAIVVAMRVYTRFVLIKKRFWEDYSILAALGSSTAMSIFVGITVVEGAGQHFQTLTPAQLVAISKNQIGVMHFYGLTHLFLKMSIMLQYSRVATLPWEKNLCFGIMAIIVAGYMAMQVTSLVRCVPFEAIWNPKYPGARCINTTGFFFAAQAFNIAMDLIILFGPLVILRHSSAPLPQRFFFGVALAFGGAAIVVAFLRLQTLVPSATSLDPTWDKVPSGVYGIVEANLGITCACIVTLRPLLHRLWLSLPSMRGTRASSSTRTQRSMPGMSRVRASLYHITLSSGNNTQVSVEDSQGRDVDVGGPSEKVKRRVSAPTLKDQ
ncbi:hypothetical protein QBC34DRAFT_349676 [Podospora aff. communis PSN243]|uniref:Rhodopsin domain-containing protein n=1 Tax=Podospora aff. communis PSN243 TaxID=3040156 RepID=A0AAV9GSF4_9PEZI|nr:hypothetical protein QBC34DRAFT_349676 [Podospora aff. communis PSN243]